MDILPQLWLIWGKSVIFNNKTIALQNIFYQIATFLHQLYETAFLYLFGLFVNWNETVIELFCTTIKNWK